MRRCIFYYDSCGIFLLFRYSNLKSHATQLSSSKLGSVFHPLQSTSVKSGHGRCSQLPLQLSCTRIIHTSQTFFWLKMVRSAFNQRKINCNAKLDKVSPVSTWPRLRAGGRVIEADSLWSLASLILG